MQFGKIMIDFFLTITYMTKIMQTVLNASEWLSAIT